MQLYCASCGQGQPTVNETIPVTCPACQVQTVWSSTPLAPAKRAPLDITPGDVRFLRSLKIDPDV